MAEQTNNTTMEKDLQKSNKTVSKEVQKILEGISQLNPLSLIELIEELKLLFNIDESALTSSGGSSSAPKEEDGEAVVKEDPNKKVTVVAKTVPSDPTFKLKIIKALKENFGLDLNTVNEIIKAASDSSTPVVVSDITRKEAEEKISKSKASLAELVLEIK